MSHSSTCLNCDEPISKKYCPNCGQKTDTHRITFKHFVTHDILHGVWHIERGILFTLKEALLRPGKAALDYISGKRIRYYNVFYFILLLIGLNLFINHWYDEIYYSKYKIIAESKSNNVGKNFEEFVSKYAKIILTMFVPIFAFNSYILFKKAKLNYSEHTIISGIIFLGILFFSAVGNVLYFFELTENFNFIAYYTDKIIPIILFIYIIISYYQAFNKHYKPLGFSIRIFLFYILCIIEIILFLLLIYGYLTNWKFGKMVLN